MIGYVCLFTSVLFSVLGTFCEKISDGFTKVLPAICVLGATVLATGLISVAVDHIDLGIAYATWSGACIVGTSILGLVIFKEKISLKKMLGIFLIIVGCVIMNFF